MTGRSRTGSTDSRLPADYDALSQRARTPVRAVLSNGLDVRLVQRSRLPITDLLLILPAGTAADDCRVAGRTLMTADLLDSGTRKRSQLDIASLFDGMGAHVSIHAHRDCTSISLQVVPAMLSSSLEVLADVVRNATYPATEFRRGKDEHLASILQDLDEPAVVAGSAIARAIFGADHIYGLPRGGTRATVERLDRDALVQCHHAGYRPAGAHAFVVGDVVPAAAIEELERAFSDWSDGTAPDVRTPRQVERRRTEIHLVDRPDAPQSELRFGTVGAPRSSPDYFPLVVLNTILGGSFTSRLNTRLREEGGYTYGAFSTFSFRSGAGPFVGGAAVSTDSTSRALVESLEEIERLRQEPVSTDELDRTRNYLTRGLARGFERNAGIAARLADIALYDLGEDHWERYAERIQAVDADAVMDAARDYLDPERFMVVVVGDAAAVRAPLQSLGIGPLVDMASDGAHNVEGSEAK